MQSFPWQGTPQPRVLVSGDNRLPINLNIQHGNAGGPPKPTINGTVETASVFVGIAAFNDQRCGLTLYNLFSKAAHPTRVFIGVVDQLNKGVQDCLQTYCDKDVSVQGVGKECRYKDQVSVLRLDTTAAKGPVFARSHQNKLLQGEEFCLQIDAHSDVTQGWDSDLIEVWKAADNEMAILSTYVHDIQSMGQAWTKTIVPIVCRSEWVHTNINN